MSKPFEYAEQCPRCAGWNEYLITPPRPAPPCSNPNSPAFSDSGDTGNVELIDGCGCEDEPEWEAVMDRAVYRCSECGQILGTLMSGAGGCVACERNRLA